MFYLGTEEDVFAKIFDEEPKRSKNAKKRNKLRRKLHSSFESISVSTFSIPSQNLRDLDCNASSKEFQECVERLKDKILRQMSQPRKFCKTVVNSQSVDSLARQFVQKLENGDIIRVKSAVRQYQREEIEKAKRDFEKCLREAYEKIDLPVTDGLEGQLTETKEVLLKTFKKSTANIDLEAAYRDEEFQNLIRFAEREIDVKKNENQLLIESMLKNNSISNKKYYIGDLLLALVLSPARTQVG